MKMSRLFTICLTTILLYCLIVPPPSAKGENFWKDFENVTLPTCDAVTDRPTALTDMTVSCVDGVRAQIQDEVNESNFYLTMAAHFSRDIINRPGFARLFFQAARAQRQHAIQLMEYLRMRGELTANCSRIFIPEIVNVVARTPIEALQGALYREQNMTIQIQNLIVTCKNYASNYQICTETLMANKCKAEKINELFTIDTTNADRKKLFTKLNQNIKADYHLVDYLTKIYLEEQYRFQRELAEKLTTLQTMMGSYGEFGEFLFDKSIAKVN